MPHTFYIGAAHGNFKRDRLARGGCVVLHLLDQVGDDFGIGLGLEGVAFVLELLLEGQVVFDDAVVHHDDVAFAVAVRVGVFLGGAAMGGPPRVADAV